MDIVKPDWPAPENVVAGVTTRNLVSPDPQANYSPYDSFNLALHVGDDKKRVLHNRSKLYRHVESECQDQASSQCWHWLNQTHSSYAIEAIDNQHANQHANQSPIVAAADASWSRQANQVCVVLTADCLPILLADCRGRAVAAIHAGWRGLLNGVVDSCVRQVCDLAGTAGAHDDSVKRSGISPGDLYAWLGPAIGQEAFEVGEDVYQKFAVASFARDSNRESIQQAFNPVTNATEPKFQCDIYQLATIALNASGVSQIYGGGFCTFQQHSRFYSYRREKITGRMASFILLKTPHYPETGFK